MSCRVLARVLTTQLFDLKVYGCENVPKRGGALILSNHQSNLDPVLLAVKGIQVEIGEDGKPRTRVTFTTSGSRPAPNITSTITSMTRSSPIPNPNIARR